MESIDSDEALHRIVESKHHLNGWMLSTPLDRTTHGAIYPLPTDPNKLSSKRAG